MSASWRRGLALVILLGLSWPARAHVGSPNVFFEGLAGPYPVHVIITPAEVIPGLAEISVRVDARGIERVTALPIKWNAGRQGAPPPDVARLVPGETNLYNAQLWFMEPGAQSVEIVVSGTAGSGKVTVPVDAIARRVLAMPKSLGSILVILAVVLVMLLLSVIGAAVRESVLAPGLTPTRRRRWGARGAVLVGAIVIALLLWGGKRWWEAEASEYKNNRLYQPLDAIAAVVLENGERVLQLEVKDSRFTRFAPLVPDHGKLMHLFMVREPAMDVFAHLHPIKRQRARFESTLPDLPAGKYNVYADVTDETGSSDTLVAAAEIPPRAGSAAGPVGAGNRDVDDSWWIVSGPGLTKGECQLNQRYAMTWAVPARLEATRPVSLRFKVHDAKGKVIEPELYLGMRGHLSLRREDGSVFTHLHPGGSASMAAMQLAVMRTEGKLPLKAAFGASEPICELPSPSASDQQWLGGMALAEEVAFPYAFPKPGRYRLWVQVRIDGEVLTGMFDAEVSPKD